MSAVLLNNGKVFIAHSYIGPSTNDYYLYGMACTISGTLIIAGTDSLLSDVTYAGNTISAVLLNSNKVFIAHSYTGNYLYGMTTEVDVTRQVKKRQDKVSGIAKTSGTEGQTIQVYTPLLTE